MDYNPNKQRQYRCTYLQQKIKAEINIRLFLIQYDNMTAN